jgi:flagellar hook-associated protein 1 FlgK
VARNLMDAVNTLHASGGGGPFFAATAGDEAGSLRVAAAPAAIVTGASGLAGDNSLALKLAALRGDAAIEGGYRAFVARVGTEVRQARTQQANATALTDAVDGRRQSVSGVSLDEEMSKHHPLPARLPGLLAGHVHDDEMLDVLINRTGRVGL